MNSKSFMQMIDSWVRMFGRMIVADPIIGIVFVIVFVISVATSGISLYYKDLSFLGCILLMFKSLLIGLGVTFLAILIKGGIEELQNR